MRTPSRGQPLRGRRVRELHSAETRTPHIANHTAAEAIVRKHWGGSEIVGLPKHTTNEAQAFAYVNWGRWLVRCPFCSSAQNASKQDHRFFCVECSNVAVKGAWLPVVWPVNWLEIEEALFKRPKRQFRNWLPGETLDDLARQDGEAIGHPRGVILHPEVDG